MNRDDVQWLKACALLVAAQWLALGIMAAAVDFRQSPPILDCIELLLPVATLAAVVLIVPNRRMGWVSAFDATRMRIYVVWLGLLLVALQMASLTWAKELMPVFEGGYWADPALADFDKRIFGTDPWRLVRHLPGDSVLPLLYAAWLPKTALAITAAMMANPSPIKTRVIVSFCLVWAFGAMFQFVLPSVGPLFYDLAGHGDRFKPMLKGGPEIGALAREWLWKFHLDGTVKAGIGISAMPSMHVAESAWIVVACRNLWPKLFVPAAIFYGLIFIGSVYIGLHYVSDGIVGTAAVAVIWWGLNLRRPMALTRPAIPIHEWTKR